jgi:SAM-dependent methyltransferase
MDFRHETKRFGQGIEVDRLHPHIFHRDYWTLLHIRQAVERFLHENAASFRGKTALDYGCGVSPYRELFRTYHLSLLRADVDPVEPDVLKINKYTGSLPLEDEAVEAVVSTQVLEHVADVRTYLREAWRVLQPGGRMLCTTHGAAILHRAPVDLRRWTG